MHPAILAVPTRRKSSRPLASLAACSILLLALVSALAGCTQTGAPADSAPADSRVNPCEGDAGADCGGLG